MEIGLSCGFSPGFLPRTPKMLTRSPKCCSAPKYLSAYSVSIIPKINRRYEYLSLFMLHSRMK
jgi:hypothetical protein